MSAENDRELLATPFTGNSAAAFPRESYHLRSLGNFPPNLETGGLRAHGPDPFASNLAHVVGRRPLPLMVSPVFEPTRENSTSEMVRYWLTPSVFSQWTRAGFTPMENRILTRNNTSRVKKLASSAMLIYYRASYGFLALVCINNTDAQSGVSTKPHPVGSRPFGLARVSLRGVFRFLRDPPYGARSGVNTWCGYYFHDKTFNTPFLTQRGSATSAFGCVALLDMGSPQSFINASTWSALKRADAASQA